MPGLDFSFAGLKTALLYRVRELGDAEAERLRADLAASYQRAIVEALALRVERALQADRVSSGWRSAAAWPPTAPCVSGWPVSAWDLTSRRGRCAPTTRR